MAKVRRMVVTRIGSVEEVRAALDVFKVKGTGGFGEAFDPVLGGQPRPDILPVIELTDRLLAYTLDRLVDSDIALQRSESEDSGLFTEQTDLMRRMGAKILRLRYFCLSQFDQAMVVRLGLDEALARSADGLLHQANFIHDHLTAPTLSLPAPEFGEQEVAPGALADRLEPERAELTAAVSTLRHERKKDTMAVIEKKVSMEEHDQVFRRLVRFLQAVFRVAGQDELAARMQPAVRRVNRSQTGEPSPVPEPELINSEPATEA